MEMHTFQNKSKIFHWVQYPNVVRIKGYFFFQKVILVEYLSLDVSYRNLKKRLSLASLQLFPLKIYLKKDI